MTMMESADQSAGEEGEYCYSWMMDPLHSSSASSSSSKGGHLDKKRRFNEEQIKSLESMFETQAKLEPRQKLQLARELGLQPRQVAIWFQNKRARLKSKQLERQYSSLRKEYEALLDSFESLKKEKQVLIKQLQSLAELLEKPREKIKREDDANHGDDAADGREERPGLSKKEESEDLGCGIYGAGYNDDGDKKLNYLSEEEQDLHRGQQQTSTLTSSEEQQLYLHNSWPLEHSSSNSQWWEFWPLNE